MLRVVLTLVLASWVLAGPATADPPRERSARAAAARRPARARSRAGKARSARGGSARARAARARERRARWARYRASLARWQTLPANVHATWQQGMRDIVFHAVNTGETVTVRPFRADGSADPEALHTLRQVLRDHRAEEDHPVDLRLVSVLYRLVVELDAPQINVISGFRHQRARGHSLHGEGQAIDLIVPGVDSDRVAAVARGFGHMGVGIYPTSGFVHLDVRDRSYFWIDRSGPGQRGRVIQVRADESRAADAAYRAEADRIVPRSDADADATVTAVAPPPPSRGRSAGRSRRAARRPGKLRAGHR